MTTFFTSDTHFNHRSILQYCPGREEHWATMEDMNEGLIARWNARVAPEDVVYHLGDFALGQFEHAQPIFDRLQGVKHLILGNHDRTATQMRKMGWASVAKGATIKAPDGRVLHLAHHPQSGDRLDQMRVDLQLCGHVHEAWKRAETSTRTSMTPPYKDYVYALPLYNGRVINVGVDVRDFEPKTLQELLNG